jgi:2-amino-4-hydroxy-6-hydroxymethyldihydropteridine diphosphokinase
VLAVAETLTKSDVRAFVGLGSNLGQARDTVSQALGELERLPQTSLRARSALYRTPPWGRTDQPDFVNAVAELRTRLSPRVLLERLLELERRFGRIRERSERWGPRELDLDLLVYGEHYLDEPGLRVPHPHLRERAFVLLPLAEIAAELCVPGQGRVRDLLAAVDVSGLEALP